MASDKEQIAQVEQAVKKRGRGGKYNFPNAVEPESPEVVRAALTPVLYWYELGVREKCMTDDEIEDRTIFFFQRCAETGERPTVEKYALALGYTRKALSDWENGYRQSARRADIIKSAKENLAAFDADLASSGKMNPVPYIFRAKNYYGMKDQTDIAIEPKQSISDASAEEIATKYQELPE